MKELSWISDAALDDCIESLLLRVKDAREAGIQRVKKNVQDPFMLLGLAHAYGVDSPRELAELESIASVSSSISSAVGKFHQSVLGQIHGFKDHDAGYDIESEDRQLLAEIKNKHNTMNAGTREKVEADLRTAVRMKPGYTGYLVIIIPKHPSRYQRELGNRVYEVDGSSFYELATDEPTALRDLYEALAARLCAQLPDIADYCREAFLSGIPE